MVALHSYGIIVIIVIILGMAIFINARSVRNYIIGSMIAAIADSKIMLKKVQEVANVVEAVYIPSGFNQNF